MFCQAAVADEIALPSPALERDKPVDVIYRLDRPGRGRGTLEVEWSDAFGRTIEQRKQQFQLAGDAEVHFSLDLRRAVAMQNQLQVHLVLDGATGHRESAASAPFLARPKVKPWVDYQIIMWQWRTAAQYRALSRIGVTASTAHVPDRDEPEYGLEQEIAPMLQSDLRWYVENIATDFYSAYHRWFPDRPVNWRFLAVRKLYRENPADPAAFVRDPSLSDPRWLERIRTRLKRTVKAQAAYRPLYYNLGDETGIADLSSFWDFDRSAVSLAGFRQWLRGQYSTLAALNQQWGEHFAHWNDIEPMTTARAMRQTDGNFSAWADFRAWMDVAFARALKAGTDAVHATDPTALAAIEGGQIPGTGGYDYAELARAVDVIELNDEGDNMEIVRSLNPALVTLTTSVEAGPNDARETWRELFRGTRGVVLWDAQSAFVNEDGTLGARGIAAAPLFSELAGGLGALLIGSKRHTDPIAMLYSPASLRTRWMLDNQPLGDAWSRRETGAETEDNALRASINRFARAIEHMGLQHRFIATAELLDGSLQRDGYRVLILPQVIALSSAEAAAIRRFVKSGGTVIADGEPGQYDQHSRRSPHPELTDLFASAPATSTSGQGKALRLAGAQAGHLVGADRALMQSLAAIFAEAGVKSAYAISGPAGEHIDNVETYQFTNGDVTIIALLGDMPAADGVVPAAAQDIVLHLPRQAYVYDLRAHELLQHNDRVSMRLAPLQPRILAVSDRPLPAPTVSAPAQARLGESTMLKISFAGATVAATSILRVEIADPAGHVVPYYSRKLRLNNVAVEQPLPFALNDPAGIWTIRVTDILSGQEAKATLAVNQP
jgi:hypothetical protein